MDGKNQPRGILDFDQDAFRAGHRARLDAHFLTYAHIRPGTGRTTQFDGSLKGPYFFVRYGFRCPAHADDLNDAWSGEYWNPALNLKTAKDIAWK